MCKPKLLWVLKFGQVGKWGTLIPNSPYVRRFLFFRPKLHFLRGWVLFLVHFLFFLSKEDFAFKIKESFKNRENENGLLEEGANPVPIKSTGSSACRTTS